MSLFNVIVEQYVSEPFLSSSSLKVQLTPLANKYKELSIDTNKQGIPMGMTYTN